VAEGRVEPVPTAVLPQIAGERGGRDSRRLLADAEPLLPVRRTPASADGLAAASRDRQTPATTDVGFDDLFGHAATPPGGGGGKGKGKGSRDGSRGGGRLGGFVILGIIVVLIGGLVAGGMWTWNQYGGKVREVMGWTEPID